MYHNHIKKNTDSARDFYNEGKYWFNEREQWISEGKVWVKHRLPFKAMEFFNMSICFAPAGSTVMAQAYSERSKIYFQIEDYQRCMDNILLAEAITVSPVLIDYHRELRVRKRICREKLRLRIPLFDANPFSFFRITQRVNPLNPAVAECLEIHNNNQYGRHIVTNKDLRAGEIIVVEETPFKALDEDGTYSRCAHCFKSNRMSLIPFDECAAAMFCSQQCLAEGRNKYICAVDEEFNVIPRILLTAFGIFNNNMTSLRRFMENARHIEKTILDFDTSNIHDPDLKDNQLLALTSLKNYECWKLMEPYIRHHPVLKKWWSASDRANVVEYMRFIAGIYSNALPFMWWQLRENGQRASPEQILSPKIQTIGVAIFLFSSLFSHSCCHNAERINVDNKIVIYARLPIKAGEQVSISYGANFLKKDRRYRRDWLQGLFNFECSCTACLEDWDRSLNLARFDPKFFKKFKTDWKTIESVRAAKFEFKENCKYIENNHTKYPCFEIQRLLDRNCYLLTAIARCEPCLFLD